MNPPSSLSSPQAVLERCLGTTEELGLALLALGSGPVPIPSAERGALALNRNGDVMFLIVVDHLVENAPAAIADELDRIARLKVEDLTQLGERPLDDLERARRERFPDAELKPPNREQRAVVLVRRSPSEADWRELVIELGRRLEGVYAIDEDGRISPLEPPVALRRPETSSTTARWGLGTWGALAAVLLGVGIVLLGLARAILVEETVPVETVASPVNVVASGTGGQATHTNWVGQRRAVTTSRGKIVFLYSGADGLQLVTDQGNRGRTWRSPITVSEAAPTSFSVTIDDDDDLHIAMLDDGVPTYFKLKQSRTGWQAEDALQLSSNTTESSVIDLAWDRESDVAHAIWSELGDSDETLRWATIAVDGGVATIVTEGTLVEVNTNTIPMLANVATGPDSTVLASYRRGDSDVGWFSQLGRFDDGAGTVTWQPEETVPTQGGIGAGSLVMDLEGSAHLLLRNDGGPQLEYYRRSPRGGWSTGEIVAEGESIDEVDHPALSVDVGSQLVYAFFQTDVGRSFTHVRLVVRDPAAGWKEPLDAGPESASPEGASLPTTLGLTQGEPIVFWTTGGASPAVQNARVTAP